MKSTIKTIILAATGATLIAASPALARTRYSAVQHTYYSPATQFYQEGAVVASPRGYIPGDTFGQIRDEYLKDAPIHNGNAY
jgi:hypothetical protein